MRCCTLLAGVCSLLFCISAGAADSKLPTDATPEDAQADPDFSRQGEYAGDSAGGQVVALGDHRFLAVRYAGGLPGAGWDGSPAASTEGTWEEIQEVVAGLKKTTRSSPTLNATPPQDAVVLFDGTQPTFEKHWASGARMTSNGLLEQGATSLDQFQSFHIHIEFRLPYMPTARGQARGNSGLYLQGRYEVQMLDSFGLKGESNECGGIYKAAAPRLNMCLPPLVWQTYDVDFTAAKFDETGKKFSNARVTVQHNGVTIHDNVEITDVTPSGPIVMESAEPGPVFLQNHGNPVRYRNIWVTRK